MKEKEAKQTPVKEKTKEISTENLIDEIQYLMKEIRKHRENLKKKNVL